MANLVGVEVAAEKVSEEISSKVASPVAKEARGCHLSPAHHGAETVAGSFQARRALPCGSVIFRPVLAAMDPVVEGVVASADAVEDCAGSKHVPPGGEGQLDRVDSRVADNPDAGSIRAAGKDAGGGSLHCVDAIAADEVIAENPAGEIEQAVGALVLGTRDYLHKSGFRKAVLGLSGGIDSALTAVVAAAALGPENVIGVTMPSRYSSGGSVSDSRQLADNLGIALEEIPIETIFSSVLDTLGPVFEGLEEDVTEENIQARIRGLLLMALSNKLNALLLTTGNKSELAVGYCTLYGDMSGGLAVISDVPKTLVYRISEWLNRDGEVIPAAIIDKPPSAELRPDQKDTDSLPSYDVLDAILEAYVEEGRGLREVVELGFEEETVAGILRMVDLNEYKRLQAAPGLRITSKAFGPGRRFPVVKRLSLKREAKKNPGVQGDE